VADIALHDGWSMNIFRNMRLKPSILTSFVVLTVPVFLRWSSELICNDG
jgi:hypothetical protein